MGSNIFSNIDERNENMTPVNNGMAVFIGNNERLAVLEEKMRNLADATARFEIKAEKLSEDFTKAVWLLLGTMVAGIAAMTAIVSVLHSSLNSSIQESRAHQLDMIAAEREWNRDAIGEIRGILAEFKDETKGIREELGRMGAKISSMESSMTSIDTRMTSIEAKRK